MRNFDPAFLSRAIIGFDRVFDLFNNSTQWAGNDPYPPYNIERTGENRYQISLALAGFSPDEITVTAEQNVLTVEGTKSEKDERHYLHQGISARPFRRVFNLADYVQVQSASFESGLLEIVLVREIPEAKKPKRIAIDSSGHDKVVEHQKAA